jgi:hypothetical protein
LGVVENFLGKLALKGNIDVFGDAKELIKSHSLICAQDVIRYVPFPHRARLKRDADFSLDLVEGGN